MAHAPKDEKSMKTSACDTHSKSGEEGKDEEMGQSELEAACARAVPIVLRSFTKTEQVENVKAIFRLVRAIFRCLPDLRFCGPLLKCIASSRQAQCCVANAPSTPPGKGRTTRTTWQARNLNLTTPLHHQSNDIREGLLTPARGGAERTPPSEGQEQCEDQSQKLLGPPPLLVRRCNHLKTAYHLTRKET